MSILVTGGAGYIGAHVVRLLEQSGEKVVVVDNLSTGRVERIGGAKLITVDIATDKARTLLANLMVDEDVSAVIHFAARKQVGESVERPAWYYQQNIGGLANILMAMGETGVDRMIFSSSAAVYGMPPVEVVSEDEQCHPINPYGETKLIGEWMMADCERAWGLNWIGLRYFNVAGTGWVDLEDPAILNLVPMVLDRLAKNEPPKIFGTDYPTPDGTCIRDYIHVLDLAHAHIAALRALESGKPGHRTYNVGTGEGTSVREIIEGIRRISGWEFPVDELPRRAGDPPKLIGNAENISHDLGWKAQQSVEDILISAWEAWQQGPRRITVPTE
ncbi:MULTISPECIES: UDP-glucose 4-epimerase GalE [unclassified Schaalia]|uniref:UDP-glucose 4-epimerase GalE n=1 Tax=unclassified Schaalia TaxID=2691889 RepID=UPI001E6472F1|nr:MULTISPECIES: UDP-glucose 4-epimerase GalE [unclassified Schaalia]MCD4549749.1 UDP-glucose 4-epimerase GalE [Schaalia sp. lx-260]MCD4556765.1 UDP-glucose 4-epimerase GalE [Schaalia sp. lx-100]